MMPRGIRFRMLGLVLAVVVPLSGVIGLGLWSQWRNGHWDARQRVVVNAKTIAAEIDNHIENLENLLAGVSRALSTNPADAETNDALLRQLKTELPAYLSNIQLFSLDGSNIGTSSDTERGRLYAGDRAYFKQVLAGRRLAIGEPIQARSSGKWTISIARPVNDQTGRMRAVLAVGTQLDNFHDVYGTHGLPASAVIRVVNEHGIVIARTSDGANWIGRDLSGLEHIKRHLAAKEASEIVPWADNVERITGSATAQKVPWLVSIGLPSDIAFAGVVSNLGWGAFLSVVTMLIALMIAWMYSANIVLPLRQLQNDAAVLATGDLKHRSLVSTRDEVGSLAETFNSMATSLEQRQQRADSAEKDVRSTRAFLDAIIENIPTMLFVKEAKENRFVLLNKAGESLLGIPRASIIGKNDYDFFPKEQADVFTERDREVLRSGKLQVIDEETIQTHHNGARLLFTKKMPVLDEEGQSQYLLGVSEDITDRKRLEETQREVKETLEAVIDASPVAIICVSTDRTVIVWSRAAEQIFGYTTEEAVGRPYKLVPSGQEAEFDALFERALAGESLREIQVQRRRKDGSLVDISFAGAAMYDADGVRGVAYALADITERRKAEENLKYLAHYDQLTGLPNRVTLQFELAEMLDQSPGSSGRPTSIAMFDLDGFKDINDTLGHSIGDRLLKEVAQRLTTLAEGTARVYRLGGDEFVAIFRECGDPRIVAKIVESMLKRIAERFEINGQLLHIRASAGIAIAPTDGSDVDDLIANADLALYDAKFSGGHTYRLFLPVLRARVQARRELDLELRRAVSESEFVLYFQPQLRLSDGAVVGAEALLRWRHPERGIVGPGTFIEALAESPVALEAGRWILQTACERAAAWRGMGLPPVRIGVNLFPAQFRDGPLLLNDIEVALQKSGLPAEALEIEITENIALGHDDAMLGSLRALREKGVALAFDDFGTGYASLSYLTLYPLSRIKIDQSFVRKIGDKPSSEDTAVVRSIIAMAHNLGLDVIAEGVETPAQSAFLQAQGCEEVQGFLYAKPLPEAEFEQFLRANQIEGQEGGRVARTEERAVQEKLTG